MKQWVCDECRTVFTTPNDAQPFPMTCEGCRSKKKPPSSYAELIAPVRPAPQSDAGRATPARPATARSAQPAPRPTTVRTPPTPRPAPAPMKSLTAPARPLTARTAPAPSASAIAAAAAAAAAPKARTADQPQRPLSGYRNRQVNVSGLPLALSSSDPAAANSSVAGEPAGAAVPAPARSGLRQIVMTRGRWIVIGSLTGLVLLSLTGWLIFGGSSTAAIPDTASAATANDVQTAPLPLPATGRVTPTSPLAANLPPGALPPLPAPATVPVAPTPADIPPEPATTTSLPTIRGPLILRLECTAETEPAGQWLQMTPIQNGADAGSLVWTSTGDVPAWAAFAWQQPQPFNAVFYVRMRYRGINLKGRDIQVDFLSEAKTEAVLPLPTAADGGWAEMESKVLGVAAPIHRLQLRIPGTPLSDATIKVDWVEFYLAQTAGQAVADPLPHPSNPAAAPAAPATATTPSAPVESPTSEPAPAPAPAAAMPAVPLIPAVPMQPAETITPVPQIPSATPATPTAPAPAAAAADPEQLNAAILKGDLATVQKLFREAPALFQTKPNSDGPIHLAATNQQREIIGFLLDNGTPVDLVSKSGQTPLYLALLKARANDFSAGELLLKRGADINAGDRYGRSVLYFAVYLNDLELLRFLIANKASVDIADTSGQRTPLFKAVEKNLRECAQILIKAGANPQFKDKKGITPLTLSSTQKNSAMTSILLGYTPPPEPAPKPAAPQPVTPAAKPPLTTPGKPAPAPAPAEPAVPGIPTGDDG